MGQGRFHLAGSRRPDRLGPTITTRARMRRAGRRQAALRPMRRFRHLSHHRMAASLAMPAQPRVFCRHAPRRCAVARRGMAQRRLPRAPRAAVALRSPSMPIMPAERHSAPRPLQGPLVRTSSTPRRTTHASSSCAAPSSIRCVPPASVCPRSLRQRSFLPSRGSLCLRRRPCRRRRRCRCRRRRRCRHRVGCRLRRCRRHRRCRRAPAPCRLHLADQPADPLREVKRKRRSPRRLSLSTGCARCPSWHATWAWSPPVSWRRWGSRSA